MIEALKDVGIIVGVPVARSVIGWAGNALEDNKVTEFEWKQLASTVLRVGTIATLGYFGVAAAGFDIPALSVAAGAYIVDLIVCAIKK